MKPPRIDAHVDVGEAVRIRAFRNDAGRKMYAIQVGHGEFLATFRDDGAPYSRFTLALQRAEKIAPALDAEIARRRTAPPSGGEWLGENVNPALAARHAPRPSNRPRRSQDFIRAGALNAAGLAAKVRAARRRMGWH